jgi:hypothetical protein
MGEFHSAEYGLAAYFARPSPKNRSYEESPQVTLGSFHKPVTRRPKMNAATLQGKDNAVEPKLYMGSIGKINALYLLIRKVLLGE